MEYCPFCHEPMTDDQELVVGWACPPHPDAGLSYQHKACAEKAEEEE